MGAGTGFFMMIINLFLLVAAVMAIFIPFWVYRIRNEVIGMNARLDRIILLNGGEPLEKEDDDNEHLDDEDL